MFTVTIKNVHDKHLGDLVARIGTKRYQVRITHFNTEEPTTTTKQQEGERRNDEAVLSLTGKTATEGSMREEVLKMMERLERKHGIGSVTRGMLRDAVVRKEIDAQVIYQLRRDGYLKYLA